MSYRFNAIFIQNEVELLLESLLLRYEYSQGLKLYTSGIIAQDSLIKRGALKFIFQVSRQLNNRLICKSGLAKHLHLRFKHYFFEGTVMINKGIPYRKRIFHVVILGITEIAQYFSFSYCLILYMKLDRPSIWAHNFQSNFLSV